MPGPNLVEVVRPLYAIYENDDIMGLKSLFLDLLTPGSYSSHSCYGACEDHGFTIAGRRVYHERSAFRAWERLFALFRRNLPQAAISAFAPQPDTGITTI